MQVVLVDVGLQFIGGEHHDDVGPLGGLGHLHGLELLALSLLDAGRALAQGDRHILHAAIAQIEDMGVPLAAVADHGHLLALDQIDVGITIVIDAH